MVFLSVGLARQLVFWQFLSVFEHHFRLWVAGCLNDFTALPAGIFCQVFRGFAGFVRISVGFTLSGRSCQRAGLRAVGFGQCILASRERGFAWQVKVRPHKAGRLTLHGADLEAVWFKRPL